MRYFLIVGLQVFAVLAIGQPQDLHKPWTSLLQKHVNAEGWVSYKGFQEDSTALNSYLSQLSMNPPKVEWSKNARLAYWINAYNAFTVKLIIDHYPVRSIKEIKQGVPFVNSVWDFQFFEIGGKKMDLNKIEHSILRKEFHEPRIHFAIVCASVSCPKLRNEAFEALTLEQQLKEQAVEFINDQTKNRIVKDEIRVSPIFKWFGKDFTKEMPLKEFISKYSQVEFASNSKVRYMDYDWSLNGE